MSISTTDDRLEVVHGTSDGMSPDVIDVTTDPDRDLALAAAGAPSSTRPTFTITDAATSCSVSRKTITRKLPELAGHGAAKDDDGVWRIPVEALLAVGLHPGRSLPEGGPVAPRQLAPPPQPVRPTELDTITIPRDRWDDVRIRLARAEAEASERGLALADARLALRALTAGPSTALRPSALSPAPDQVAPQGATDTGAVRTLTAPSATVGGAAASQPGEATPPGPGTDPGISSQAPIAPDAAAGDRDIPAPGVGPDAAPADVVAARNRAARTGGYVPAGATPTKKRRWWQSR
jgi:hypothetical protein